MGTTPVARLAATFICTVLFLLALVLPTARAAPAPAIALSAAEKAWIAAHPHIRLGTDPEFAPFEYTDKDGRYQGIAASYIALLNKRLGLHMEVVPNLRWRDVPPMAQRKEIDVLPCVGKTKDRERYLLYSRPYLSFSRVILTRIETPFISGIDDLGTMRVAVQAHSSHEGYLRDHTTISPITYPDLQSALLALSNGKTDAFVGNVASATYWIRKLNLTNLKVAAPVGGKPEHLYFAVRDDWPQLVSIINKGLGSITTAEREAIRRRWVDIEYPPGIPPHEVRRIVLQVIAAAVIILLVILFWNRRLHQEIERRKEIEAALERAREELEDRVRARTAALAATNDELTAEIRRRTEAQRRLALAEAQWRNTFNSISDFISVLDLDHRILRVNDAFAAFLGLPADKIKGRHCYEVFHHTPAPIAHCPHTELIRTGRPCTREVFDQEREMHFLVTDSPLYQDGELVGSVHISKDITTQKKAELELKAHRDHLEELVAERTRELSKANEELKQLDRLKSMFIASMSHELRTPLNSIIGFTGIILQGMVGGLTAKQKDHLERVYRSAKHLLNLITDVIDISKIEAGRVDVFPEPVVLRTVVDEAVAAIEPQLCQKGLGIEVRLEEEIELTTDRKRLLQALINLMSNAVKYTEEGTVTVEAAVEGEQLRLTVRDTGIGIAPEEMPKLFEAFERLPSHLRVKAGGTGLGLYLTRKLVTELLGGEITVASEPGQGSVFTVTIPVILREKRETT